MAGNIYLVISLDAETNLALGLIAFRYIFIIHSKSRFYQVFSQVIIIENMIFFCNKLSLLVINLYVFQALLPNAYCCYGYTYMEGKVTIFWGKYCSTFSHRNIEIGLGTARFWVLIHLPQLFILFFPRNFNHTRFINYSCSSLSFFNNSDDPGLVSLLLFNVL